MKAAILRICPPQFRALMQLPEGAVISSIRTDFERHGDLLIKLIGVGHDVVEGQMISEFGGTITTDGDGNPEITWHLPSANGGQP